MIFLNNGCPDGHSLLEDRGADTAPDSRHLHSILDSPLHVSYSVWLLWKRSESTSGKEGIGRIITSYAILKLF